jgi:hypothetical protein
MRTKGGAMRRLSCVEERLRKAGRLKGWKAERLEG